MKIVYLQVLSLAVFCLILQNVNARHIRERRVSDQRLAELEALLALSKMKGKLVTVPLGFGKVDPMRIGRRRRSNMPESGFLGRLYSLSQSEDEDPGSADEELDRLLQEE